MSDSQNSPFYQNDLDLDPMTLKHKINLDVVKMYRNAKYKVPSSTVADRLTDRQYENITLPHTRSSHTRFMNLQYFQCS